MVETSPYYFVGDGIEKRPEVRQVKNALFKMKIFLEGFGLTITGVYARPRPVGFDFICGNPNGLRELARSRSVLGEDNTDTADGKFVALMTDGNSFRQIGTGH